MLLTSGRSADRQDFGDARVMQAFTQHALPNHPGRTEYQHLHNGSLRFVLSRVSMRATIIGRPPHQ
jgi:hypothetical protein